MRADKRDGVLSRDLLNRAVVMHLSSVVLAERPFVTTPVYCRPIRQLECLGGALRGHGFSNDNDNVQ